MKIMNLTKVKSHTKAFKKLANILFDSKFRNLFSWNEKLEGYILDAKRQVLPTYLFGQPFHHLEYTQETKLELGEVTKIPDMSTGIRPGAMKAILLANHICSSALP